MDSNNTVNTTITTASSCQYMLPCGMCRLTNGPCLKNSIVWDPTWTYDPGPTCINGGNTNVT